jgi:hypothetical protein
MTVDAVMIYAQAGHGRRANLYTDFTFAMRDGDALVPFTKAYSGLTDAEFPRSPLGAPTRCNASARSGRCRPNWCSRSPSRASRPAPPQVRHRAALSPHGCAGAATSPRPRSTRSRRCRALLPPRTAGQSPAHPRLGPSPPRPQALCSRNANSHDAPLPRSHFDANAIGGNSMGDLPEWDLRDLYTPPPTRPN